MMTVVVIALAIQIIIAAQIHTVLDHESGGTRTPTLAVHNTRAIPLSQAPAGSHRCAPKKKYMKVLYMYEDQMISSGDDHTTYRSERAGRAERAKNGNSAHANAGSIGPSALDREDRDAQT